MKLISSENIREFLCVAMRFIFQQTKNNDFFEIKELYEPIVYVPKVK